MSATSNISGMDAYRNHFNQPTIKIVIGGHEDTPKEDFYVHTNIICKPGTFFETASKKQWQRGERSTVELPHDWPHIFKLYIRWLYTGTIFCQTAGAPCDFDTLAHAYGFGERLLDRLFQDGVVDAMFAACYGYIAAGSKDRTLWCPGLKIIDVLYKGTPDGSPVRRFLVDVHLFSFFVYRDAEVWMVAYAQEMEHINQEFLTDLVAAFAEETKELGEFQRKLEERDASPRCSYHHYEKR